MSNKVPHSQARKWQGIDKVTLGRIRQDVEKTAGKMLLLTDPDTGFTVVGAFGEGAEKLSAAVKRMAQTGGDKEAQAAVEKMATDHELKTTLGELRTKLRPGEVETISRNDEDGKFLNIAAAGDAAELIYNVLVDVGILRPEDRVGEGPETAQA